MSISLHVFQIYNLVSLSMYDVKRMLTLIILDKIEEICYYPYRPFKNGSGKCAIHVSHLVEENVHAS